MQATTKELIQKMLTGDVRSLARLMSYVDNRHDDVPELIASVAGHAKAAYRVGVTGPPGSGKSTLVDHLVKTYRKSQKTVGVIAVDPSSPFSGGAVLGDRIRMQGHNADEGVFIRSLSSRGVHGGLSEATRDVLKLLDAFGVNVVIIETVGVGQTELDIMSVADTTVVVLVPESGDMIQAMKAGIMEIADIFIVNKADREGADRVVMELTANADGHAQGWAVPVIKTVAIQGEGIDEVVAAIEGHKKYIRESVPLSRPRANGPLGTLSPGGRGEKNGAKPLIKSINPATRAVIGEVPNMPEQEVEAAIVTARKAQPFWQALGIKARVDYILRARDEICRDMDAIAELITRENGKPLVESVGSDIMPVLDLMTYFAKKGEKLLHKERIKLGKWGAVGRRSHLEFYPYGVVGVIAPWNYPLSIPLGEVVMALIVGNVVVLKPSEYTPLVGLKIKEIFERVGLPRGVLHVVTGDGAAGAALVRGGCDKIVFTGSVATGKKIVTACAEKLTPFTLELGGKDPFIVFADADLDVASSAAVWGAFSNSGQICASVERVYVHDSVYDQFTKLVVQKTQKLRQGLGQSLTTDVSAMTAEMQLNKVKEQVEEARQRGASILCGGEENREFKGWFYAPTVITGVDHSFSVVKEETFGPVMPIMKFSSDDEAVRLANDSEYALNAYVWSRDRARAQRLSSQIVAGTVNINESVFTFALPQTPWGGPKHSGMGRTHGALGLMDLVQVRHVHENTRPTKRNFFWWYAYGPEKLKMLKLLNHALFGKGIKRFVAFIKFIVMSFRVRVS